MGKQKLSNKLSENAFSCGQAHIYGDKPGHLLSIITQIQWLRFYIYSSSTKSVNVMSNFESKNILASHKFQMYNTESKKLKSTDVDLSTAMSWTYYCLNMHFYKNNTEQT